jgi:hypothetical protein
VKRPMYHHCGGRSLAAAAESYLALCTRPRCGAFKRDASQQLLLGSALLHRRG